MPTIRRLTTRRTEPTDTLDAAHLQQLLAARPEFADVDARELRALAGAGRLLVLPSSWAFIQEGTPSDAAYLILDGTAVVYRGRREIARLGAGEVVGEVGLVARALRTATVASSGRLTALRLDYTVLDAVLAGAPGLRRALADVAHRRATAA